MRLNEFTKNKVEQKLNELYSKKSFYQSIIDDKTSPTNAINIAKSNLKKINDEINMIELAREKYNRLCDFNDRLSRNPKKDYNIENYYLYPLDITVCCGGNHSQLSAYVLQHSDRI